MNKIEKAKEESEKGKSEKEQINKWREKGKVIVNTFSTFTQCFILHQYDTNCDNEKNK